MNDRPPFSDSLHRGGERLRCQLNDPPCATSAAGIRRESLNTAKTCKFAGNNYWYLEPRFDCFLDAALLLDHLCGKFRVCSLVTFPKLTSVTLPRFERSFCGTCCPTSRNNASLGLGRKHLDWKAITLEEKAHSVLSDRKEDHRNTFRSISVLCFDTYALSMSHCKCANFASPKRKAFKGVPTHVF